MEEEIYELEDIKSKYTDGWVLLFDCEFSDSGELRKGKVVLHSLRRDEIYRNLSNYKGYKGNFAIKHMGEIPKDLSVLLWGK